jgi:hypothetical protein
MAGLFQGDPLPDITKTSEQQQVAPEFYTNYLQDIANLGQNAIQQGGVAGFSNLQQQALGMAPGLAFSGSGSLGQASQMINQAGASTIPGMIQPYMNPYTTGVVDEMGRLAQRNISENVLPNLAGAAVGAGQFGSRRQQQITGNVMRDLQADLLGRQTKALQEGYTEAGKFAGEDLNRSLNAGRALSSLGEEQQQLGLGGLKALYDFGGYEQGLAQRQLDLPMQQAQAFSKLLEGARVPMGTKTQDIGPIAGAYSQSPLAQIAGLLTGLGSFMRTTGGGTAPAPGNKNGGAIKRPPMAATMRGKGYRVGGRVR